jgi:hypothetical protein
MILFRLFSQGCQSATLGLEFANAFSVKGKNLYSREFVLANNSFCKAPKHVGHPTDPVSAWRLS